MKLLEANLQVYEKKLIHTSSFMYFAFIFSERITITSSEEALKVCEHNFFRKQKVLLLWFTCSITIHLSQLHSCWMWHLTLSWVRYTYKLEFIAIQKYNNILLFAQTVYFDLHFW